MTLPLNALTSGAALLAIGFIVGALAFSYVIGRRRARILANVANQLARAGFASRLEAIRYPDEVLRTALKGLAERIADVEALATTDPQTRLHNRMATLAILEAEIDRTNRYQRPLSVALFDIDHFKRVNDTHGHAIGDDVLRHVAAILKDNVRSVDTIGRYGGEEFLLVMPETDLEGGMASAENLRRILGRTPVTVETPNGAVHFQVVDQRRRHGPCRRAQPRRGPAPARGRQRPVRRQGVRPRPGPAIPPARRSHRRDPRHDRSGRARQGRADRAGGVRRLESTTCSRRSSTAPAGPAAPHS